MKKVSLVHASLILLPLDLLSVNHLQFDGIHYSFLPYANESLLPPIHSLRERDLTIIHSYTKKRFLSTYANSIQFVIVWEEDWPFESNFSGIQDLTRPRPLMAVIDSDDILEIDDDL